MSDYLIWGSEQQTVGDRTCFRCQCPQKAAILEFDFKLYLHSDTRTGKEVIIRANNIIKFEIVDTYKIFEQDMMLYMINTSILH